jgi:cytochrome c553
MRLEARKKGLLAALLLVALALWSEAALAAGDYNNGAKLSIYCAYCHGYDGNPLDGAAPRLAGKKVDYIVARIKELERTGKMHQAMHNAFMTGELTDRDVVDLATYFSRQPVRKQ